MSVPSGVICAWVGTNASIPTGWNRATAYDARYVQQIASSNTAPGSTGGSTSHSHNANCGATHCHSYSAHTHSSWGNVCSNTCIVCPFCTTPRQSVSPKTHSHTGSDGGASASSTATDGSTTWTSLTAEPPFLQIIFIKSNGTPSGLPNNALALFNGAAPSGWSEHVNSRNRIWKGMTAGGDGGGTGGTGDSHTHAYASHTHGRSGTHTHTVTFGTPVGGTNACGGVSGTHCRVVATLSHTHASATSGATGYGGTTTCAATDASGSGDVTPPWQKMLGIQNTSGSDSLPVNLICIWDGVLTSIPIGWILCDGTSGTPNLSQGKFVRGANGAGEVGNVGGAATHGHGSGSHLHADSGTHTHTNPSATGATSATVATHGCCTGLASAGSHTHPDSGSSNTATTPSTAARTMTVAANTDNNPTWTGVAYIQLSFNAIVANVSITTTATVQRLISLRKSLVVTSTISSNKLLKQAGATTALVAIATMVSATVVHLRTLARVRRVEVSAPGSARRQDQKRAEVQAPGVARRIDE